MVGALIEFITQFYGLVNDFRSTCLISLVVDFCGQHVSILYGSQTIAYTVWIQKACLKSQFNGHYAVSMVDFMLLLLRSVCIVSSSSVVLFSSFFFVFFDFVPTESTLFGYRKIIQNNIDWVWQLCEWSKSFLHVNRLLQPKHLSEVAWTRGLSETGRM